MCCSLSNMVVIPKLKDAGDEKMKMATVDIITALPTKRPHLSRSVHRIPGDLDAHAITCFTVSDVLLSIEGLNNRLRPCRDIEGTHVIQVHMLRKVSRRSADTGREVPLLLTITDLMLRTTGETKTIQWNFVIADADVHT